MIKIVLIGSGNVAIHLASAFSKSTKIDLVQRFSRNNTNENYFDKNISVTNKVEDLLEADIYIIAISDKGISDFSKQLHFKKGLVVHTSGSMPLNALLCKANKGVLYPIQTFSKDQLIRFKNISFALETEKEEDFKLLEIIATILGDKAYKMDTLQRSKLHIAAVFANNFANHMFKIAYDICIENDFSFDILKPLIIETVKKIETLTPMEAQTGPAKRDDKIVIKKQASQLDSDKKEIYELLSSSISKAYN